jgi:signal transduction histidine kinase
MFTVTLVISVGAVVSGVIPDYAAVPASVTVAYAIYAVGLQVPTRASVIAVGTAMVGLTAALLVASRSSASPDIGDHITSVCAVVVVIALGWLGGRTTAERRANLARVARQQTERAVDEERLRIARELHDVVAHSMSLIAVKAGVANHLADQRPEELKAALAVIENTSRTALADIRHALGRLRPSAPATDHRVRIGEVEPPAPGFGDIPGLVARTAAAGLRVNLTMPPPGTRVPDDVGRAVYRIVQESLTNVVNHAGPTAVCRAEVAVAGSVISVSIVDNGPGRVGHDKGGHGITGMRERVAFYGGEFTAGPGDRGGFAVRARLPLVAGGA